MNATKQKVIVNKEALLKILAKLDISIGGLAKSMHVAPSTIYRAIDDKNPKGVGGETIANMLSALGLSEADFSKLFIITDRCI